MKSKAALGNHPLHPALVAIPIGAFSVTLIADLCVLAGGNAAWKPTAGYALVIGVITALIAAVFGFIDYFLMPMSGRGKKLATTHMVCNLIAVVLFFVSHWMRHHSIDGWTTSAFAVSTLAFVILLVSGWIGGDMVYQHKLAVCENVDPEATAIGQREST